MTATSKCAGTIQGNDANKVIYQGVIRMWIIVNVAVIVIGSHTEKYLGGVC